MTKSVYNVMILIAESGCAVVKSQGHLGNAGLGGHLLLYLLCQSVERTTRCAEEGRQGVALPANYRCSRGGPNRPARQLPDQPTTLWVDPSSTGVPRRRGALSAFGGKADGNHCVGDCPLIAISGHSATRVRSPKSFKIGILLGMLLGLALTLATAVL